MLKVLAWVVSNDGRFFNGAINILERQHNGIEIIGVTANAPIQLTKDGRKVTFIPLAEVDQGGGYYDVLLVVGAKEIGMSRITQAARQLHLPEEKLLGDWIVCIPGFTLDKYRRLQRSRLSIISKNCFGGIISHLLNLPFLSPFVNLSVRNEQECLRLFQNLRSYMDKELTFKGTNFEYNLKFDYPIYTCGGDVDIHMNHYRDFDEALTKWNERKHRINWDNLFVVSFTEDAEILEEFDTLPYAKKVCFTLLKSDLPSAWYINPEIKGDNQLWRLVNHFGAGSPFYYDPFDMLLYGKKTQLIDM